MAFLVRWLINAVALWVTTKAVAGIDVSGSTTFKNMLTLFIVALIFGLVNAIIKPIVKLVGCLFYLLTLGLISFFVNAMLFLLVDWIADLLDLPFHIDGFWPAFWGAIVMSLVSWGISLVIPDRLDGK